MRVHARGSGLLIAERPAPPRDIAAQLARLDSRLELRSEADPRWRTIVWRVFVSQGDRPSVWLLDWRENLTDGHSRPRPLSSGIVDEAASLRRGHSRRVQPDPLVENDRLRERAAKDDLDDALTAAAENAKRARRSPVFPRSRSLYLARSRARNRGENV